MSNRTDFENVASEIVEFFSIEDASGAIRARLDTELHDAFVAGQEGEALDRLAAAVEADDDAGELARLAATIAAGMCAGPVPDQPSDGWYDRAPVAERAVAMAREIQRLAREACR